MKKIITLSLTLVVLAVCQTQSHAQAGASVQQRLEKANQKFITWFNTGKVDSILTQYSTNACLAMGACGTTSIKTHYESEIGKYTFRELRTDNVTVKDNLATETGKWKIQLASGSELSGKYRTEWQRVNNTWLIVKESILE